MKCFLYILLYGKTGKDAIAISPDLCYNILIHTYPRKELHSSMYITYQGTAAAEGVPAIFCDCEHCRYARARGGKEVRMRSGALIDGKLKIDFGPDAYAQSLRFNQSYAALGHVLITHSHPDHFSPDELGRIAPPDAHRKTVLHVYGDARVGEGIKPYLKESKLVFTQLKPFETYEIDEYLVTPLKAVHAINSGEEPLFYLIERGGRSILYAHDTDMFTDEDFDFLRGKRIDLISMDCTNGILNHLKYIGHMGIEKNFLLREKLLTIGAADENTTFVANHFSHNGLVSHENLEKLLPGFLVSYDGMTLRV